MLRGYSRYGLGGLSLLLAAALLAAGPAAAAGFSIFEAGSRSTAMGGAFVAQADDLSAMFYNPAGLAKYTKKGELKVMAGVTLIIPTSELAEGYNPYPGQGYSSKMHDQFFFPPNLYMSYGLSECVSLSFGTWFPFGLATRWSEPDWRGRYLSTYVDLKQYAAGLQVAWQINDYLAVGVGPEFRFTDVKLQRKIPLFNPYTNRVVDAAHTDIRADMEMDVTFGAGIKINADPEALDRRLLPRRGRREVRRRGDVLPARDRLRRPRRRLRREGPAEHARPGEDDDPGPGADPGRHLLRLRQGRRSRRPAPSPSGRPSTRRSSSSRRSTASRSRRAPFPTTGRTPGRSASA